jgi:2-aminoethylphosphonate-pyruvate transaminase
MLPPEEYSCVLWSWLLPQGLNYSDIHSFLKKNGFVVYAGQGDFGKQIFRIAHMGDIRNEDLDRLEQALRECFG